MNVGLAKTELTKFCKKATNLVYIRKLEDDIKMGL